jgi:hypothetical protein
VELTVSGAFAIDTETTRVYESILEMGACVPIGVVESQKLFQTVGRSQISRHTAGMK